MAETEDKLKILFLEDVPSDKELAEMELRKDGIVFTSVLVETKKDFTNALKEFKPDLIISDYVLPSFDGMQALKIAKEFYPSIPFIIYTGSMNEETAVECIKAGAWDYVIKEHSTRLPFAVKETLELKAKKNALKESETLYYDLVETSQDLIWQCDAEGRFIYLNPAWEQIFGYKINEMTGKTFFDFQTPGQAEIDRNKFNDVLLGNAVKGLETVFIDRAGNEIHLVFNAIPVTDQNGIVTGTRGTAYDITERHHFQQALVEQIERMEMFQKMFIGREIKMIELKNEINSLLNKDGKENKYEIYGEE